MASMDFHISKAGEENSQHVEKLYPGMHDASNRAFTLLDFHRFGDRKLNYLKESVSRERDQYVAEKTQLDKCELGPLDDTIKTLKDRCELLETLYDSTRQELDLTHEVLSKKDSEVTQLQEQVTNLQTLLSLKKKQLTTLRAVLETTKNTAEVALDNVKSKYENEKTIVSESMNRLRNEFNLAMEKIFSVIELEPLEQTSY